MSDSEDYSDSGVVATPISQRRFRFKSYNETLKEVHLPSALGSTTLDYDVEETDSQFHSSLQHWREICVHPSFLYFFRQVEPKSRSIALLLHNEKDIVDLWSTTIATCEEDAVGPLLEVLQALTHDLRVTLIPSYPSLLATILNILPSSTSTKAPNTPHRKLSANTLTTLLKTLSSLFRYVLLPSPQLLQPSWTLMRRTMIGLIQRRGSGVSGEEMERMLAEVWGAFLRRLRKPEAKDLAVSLLAEGTDGCEEGIAWVVISSMQGPAHTIHPSSPAILSLLVDKYLACSVQDAAILSRLFRRVLISLVNHTATPKQFESISDVLFSSYKKELESENLDGAIRVTRLWEILGYVCATKKGARLTAKQISSLISLTASSPTVSSSLEHKQNAILLEFISAALVAGDMTCWMGPGKKIVDRIFGYSPLTGLRFAALLAELQWAGWKLVVVGPVIKHLVGLLKTEDKATSSEALAMVTYLFQQGRLNEIGASTKEELGRWAVGRLSASAWNADEELDVLDLTSIASISSFIPSEHLSPVLVPIVQNLLHTYSDGKTSKVDFDRRPANAAWVLSSCLNALAGTGYDVKNEIEIWTRRVLGAWSWSSDVLTACLSLIASNANSSPLSFTIPFDDAFTHLRKSILSPYQSLRIASLQFLLLPVIPSSQHTPLLQRLLATEQVSIDHDGCKDRVNRISLFTTDSEAGFDILGPWLLAQLKVNLKPLWAPAIKTMANLMRSYPVKGWEMAFAEIQKTCGEDGAGNPDALGVVAPSWKDDGRDVDQLETPDTEKTWNDWDRNQVLRAMTKFGDGMQHARGIQLLKAQLPARKLDVANYETQLLHLLAECPHVAERNSQPLVTHFLSENTPQMRRPRLMSYLTLFSKFKKPANINSAATLRALHRALLSEPDRSLQRLALTCLLTYQSPHLKPYEQKLLNVVDDKGWRSGVAQWDSDEVAEHEREEVVDVALRLMYGLLLNRRGSNKSSDNKTAILSTMGRARPEELATVAGLMLAPFGGLEQCMMHHQQNSSAGDSPYVLRGTGSASHGQMSGFLLLLQDVMRVLGPKVQTYWPALFAITVEITAVAQAEVDNAMDVDGPAEEDDDEVEDKDDTPEEAGEAAHTAKSEQGPRPPRFKPLYNSKAARVLRKVAFKRLDAFFASSIPFDFTPYMRACFKAFITPRLGSLQRENLNTVGTFLPLIVTWSRRAEYVPYLQDYEPRLLPTVFDCLGLPHVGPDMAKQIFDIIENLLRLSKDDGDAMDRVFRSNIGCLLANYSIMFQRNTIGKSDTAFNRQVEVLSLLAPFIEDGSQAVQLFSLLLPPLKRNAKAVPETMKAHFLHILENLITLVPDMQDVEGPVFRATYELLSGLFNSIRSREARDALVNVFGRLSQLDHSLESIHPILADLNSFTERVDEQDVNRRLEAFATLNEKLYTQMTPRQWLPLIANVLYVARDTQEFPLRNAASHSVRRLIERAVDGVQPELSKLFTDKVYSGLLRTLESGSEDARSDVLVTLSYAAEKGLDNPTVKDLQSLQKEGRDEDVLLNLHHVQRPQRLRALRRLGEACDQGSLQSKTLADVFLPVVTAFMQDASNQPLVDEAVTTIGKIAGRLEWNPYHGLFRRHMNLAKAKSSNRRINIRAAIAILNGFHFPMQDLLPEAAVINPLPVEAAEADEDAMEVVDTALSDIDQRRKVYDAVNTKILPELLKFVEVRDDTEDKSRIPMALGIVRIAVHLPSASRRAQVSRLLTILSQTFRSKSIETRALTRDTLIKIMGILGWEYLPALIKELRVALTRGPQLHILASVVYILLKHVTSNEETGKLGNLDDCVDDAAHIAAEVIFGQSATDVTADGFHSGTKEVAGSSNRGQETFTILAKHVSPSKIGRVLEPVRAIMHETTTLRMMNLVDEVLRRTALGLEGNPRITPSDILSLSYSLATQNAKFLQQAPRLKRRDGRIRADVAVNLKVQRRPTTIANHFAINSFRFVNFGLELFVTSFRKGRFAKNDPDILSRLEPFVSVIGDTLSSTESKVVTLGLRSLSAIVRFPLKSLQDKLPELVQQVIGIVEQAGNTESDVVQTALKTLASLLRDCPDLELPQDDLIFLLKTMSPDIEEQSRQENVFALLQAMVMRKFMAPEIYDAMDRIAEIMVTSQSPRAQDLARDVYFIFVTDYPQGKARLKETMEFLARNLSYVYETGRKSVMSLLSRVFESFKTELLLQYSDVFFMALVMVLANDDSPKCREMGGTLMKALVERMDDSRRASNMEHVHGWAMQNAKPALRRVAMQLHGIFTGVVGQANRPYINTVLEDVKGALEDVTNSSARRSAQDEDGNEASKAHLDEEWQLAHQSLTTLTKVLRVAPDLLIQSQRVPWHPVFELMLYPHTWVRLAATRIQGQMYTATPVAAPTNHEGDHPLALPKLVGSARKLTMQLESSNLDAAFGLQIVKNLFYIGRCFYQLTVGDHEAVIVHEAHKSTAESEEEVDEEDVPLGTRSNMAARNPLGWMFTSLAAQLKVAMHSRQVAREISPNWAECPSSIIRWFAAMASHMDVAATESFLPLIVAPLYRVLETKLYKDARFDELKTLALELQQLLQDKVGATKYTFAYSDVLQEASRVRERRRAKETSQLMRNTESAGKRKQHQQALKHEARKRKAKDALKGRDTKKYKGW